MTQEKALEVLKSGKNVFLTGEPGSGKTYTTQLFIDWCKSVGKTYAVTASTGIAATHLKGVTIHSWSAIKVKDKITDADIQEMFENRFIRERLCDTDVLIIDEVSMLSGEFIALLDQVLSRMRNVMQSTPFGGIQVIFVGDFFQLPPISRNGDPIFAFEAEAWKKADLSICYLTEQHRQSDPVFLDLLTAMRSGVASKKHRDILTKCKKNKVPLTHLFTHNIDVDRLNDKELAKIKAEQHQYEMMESGNSYLVSVLKRQILSPELLKLKVGAVVMFTRNNFDAGYANGSIGVVDSFHEQAGFPIIKLKDGKMISPGMEEWTIEENGVTKAAVNQYPLRLAWAMSVHKSQGITLDEATIDLSKTFEYGQGYVAISRIRSLAGLHLHDFNAKTFSIHPKVIAQDKIFRQYESKN